MPYKDPEKAAEFDREYRKRRRMEDPEFAERQREKSRRWIENHPEEARESRKRAKAKARSDPEKLAKIREQQRASYQRNREARLAWYRKNREENGEELNARARAYTRRDRLAALAAYGGVCACCGETDERFLCFDHVNGGGERMRREVHGQGRQFYGWLKRNGYPDGFRVLCHNCNYAFGQWGACPHGEQRGDLAS